MLLISLTNIREHPEVVEEAVRKYHCTEKNKDLPFGILQCHKCKYYEKRLISD